MSRKRNARNEKITSIKGMKEAANNRFGPWGYIAPATRIAKAQSEKYRTDKKK